MFGRQKKPRMPGVPRQGIVTDERHLLSVGTPGTAVIRSAYDSKIYVDEIDSRIDPSSPMVTDAIWTVALTVTIPGHTPYDVSMTIRVPREAIPRLGNGAPCIIAAHPEHPDTTVAIDWSQFPAS